ncbi:MAG: NAD(P)/FAD-dependent oxidoreductase, partial [Bacteroidota bacterium]
MDATTTPILIIGAGPAGLAVAGRLRKTGLDFQMLEASEKIAWSWHNHYDRLCLHTVKQLSHLPHLPFEESYPLYVPRLDLIKYYEDYARHFDIKPAFGEAVQKVTKAANYWQVESKSGKRWQANQVVFATGVNRVPHVPQFTGQENFQGEIIHSRHYRNPEPFKGKETLVIGMGNTGAEIALDLAEAGVKTYLSVRSPITIVPRDVMGNPVQLTARKLDKLPFGLGDWIGTQVRKFVIGNLQPYGVPLSKVHPAQQLRETGKTPVIDLGTVGQIKAGNIQMRHNIDHFTER